MTEADGKLIDALRIRRLLLARPDQKLAEMVSSTLVSLFAGDSVEDAVKVFRLTDLYALPFTSSSGKILGIVTLDDVLDLAEERASFFWEPRF